MNVCKRLALAAVVFGGLALTSICNAASASIWTVKDINGTDQQTNHFGPTDEVYFNGANFAAGTYYYRVISPGGTLLSDLPHRSVVVGENGILGRTPLRPFAATDNANGDYKVQISSTVTFSPGTIKSSNFKVGSVDAGCTDTEPPTIHRTVTQKGGTSPAVTPDGDTFTINIAPSMFPLTFSFTAEDNITEDPTIEISDPTQSEGRDATYTENSTSSVTLNESGGIGNVITFSVTATDDCLNETVHDYVINVVRGNQGVGNGEDANTPGNIPSGENDTGGTPGSPGAKMKPKK